MKFALSKQGEYVSHKVGWKFDDSSVEKVEQNSKCIRSYLIIGPKIRQSDQPKDSAYRLMFELNQRTISPFVGKHFFKIMASCHENAFVCFKNISTYIENYVAVVAILKRSEST